MSPYAAPRICSRCRRVVPAKTACPCRPAFTGSQHPGGTRKMAALRRAKLHADPLCEHAGCRLLAVEVDHITPLAEGGQRYDWRNLQSLCTGHHAAKTADDARRGRGKPR